MIYLQFILEAKEKIMDHDKALEELRAEILISKKQCRNDNIKAISLMLFLSAISLVGVVTLITFIVKWVMGL